MGRTARWVVFFLLLLETGARLVSRPEVLLRLGVASYPTCFAHRMALARAVRPPAVSTVVLGDSTAERGVNACSLGASLGGRGLNVSLASGTTGEASRLFGVLDGAIGAHAEVVYAVNPLNVRTYSEWITPTFADLWRRTDFASAALGELSTMFGKRQVVLAVLESFVDPERYREEFHGQIGLTGECGRETSPPLPSEIPDAAARRAQIADYAANWVNVFEEQVGVDVEQELASALRGWTTGGRRVTVVLTPLRRDFIEFLAQTYPGLVAKRHAIWTAAVRRAGVSGLWCASAVDDLDLFVDPVHLNENGRRALTTEIGGRLKARDGACEVL